VLRNLMLLDLSDRLNLNVMPVSLVAFEDFVGE
jgi:hypothetical protein